MKATRFLAPCALAVLGVAAAPAVASADVGIGVSVVVGHGRHAPARDAYRHGFQRGRADGAEHGYRDGRRRRDFDFRHSSDYRHGDRGYRRWMGPRGAYVDGYRDGYESAYRRAYASARPGGHGRDGRRAYDRRRDPGRYRSDDRR